MAGIVEAPVGVGAPPAAGRTRRTLLTSAVAALVLVVTAVLAGALSQVGWTRLVDSYTLTNLVIGVSLVVSGLLIGWHRPGNAVGPLFVVAGLGHLLTAAATMVGLYAGRVGSPLVVTRTLGAVTAGAWQFGLGLLFPLALLLFPDGHLPSPRWRPAAWVIVVAGGYQIVTGLLSDGSPLGDDARNSSILSVGLVVPGVVTSIAGAVYLAGWLLVIASMVWRYARGDSRARRQLQWLLLAVLLDLVINGQRTLTANGPILLLLSFVFVPVAIAIAIVRYQLLDIQLVISRTLLYGLVVAVVVAGYAGLVAALSLVVPAGAERGVSIVAALAVAIAFNPLRLLAQRLVARAFYGTRADPAGTASGVARQLQETDDLAGALERIRATLRLPGLAITQPQGGVVASAGVVADPQEDLPLTFQATTVGTLLIGLRRGEAVLHSADRRTLDLIVTPLAAVLHADALTEQVQLARTATVEAAAAERVRLQRELHDGVGPLLTSVGFTADAVHNLMRSDLTGAERMLAEVRSGTREALDEVRRVVHGLRPIELDDLGLAGALRQRVAALATSERVGPQIRLQLPGDLVPLSAAVELAAYRIVLEALTNVLRHSSARHCDVTLVSAADALTVTVDDDGEAPRIWTPGVGLRSLAERAEELGGSATAGPGPRGWRVRAVLPQPATAGRAMDPERLGAGSVLFRPASP